MHGQTSARHMQKVAGGLTQGYWAHQEGFLVWKLFPQLLNNCPNLVPAEAAHIVVVAIQGNVCAIYQAAVGPVGIHEGLEVLEVQRFPLALSRQLRDALGEGVVLLCRQVHRLNKHAIMCYSVWRMPLHAQILGVQVSKGKSLR